MIRPSRLTVPILLAVAALAGLLVLACAQEAVEVLPDTPTPALSTRPPRITPDPRETPPPETTKAPSAATPFLPTPAATPTRPPVPVAVDPPPGVSCPEGWSFFDNPAIGYSICYPPGWGFNDGSSDRPLAQVSEASLGHIALLSSEWFPFPVGLSRQQFPSDVRARVDQGSWLNVTFVSADEKLVSGCDLTNTTQIDGQKASWCVERFDLEGGAAPSRPDGFYRQLVLVVLLNAPDTTAGSKLLAVIGTSNAVFDSNLNLYWQILRSISVP